MNLVVLKGVLTIGKASGGRQLASAPAQIERAKKEIGGVPW